MSITTPVRPRSLAATAYETLRDRLISLEISPGEPLDDDALSQELQMGRTPIREAFKRLETEGLVTTYPKRGTFASAIEMTDQANIYVIREHLEPLAATLAARKASPTQRTQMRELLSVLRQIDPSSKEGPEILDIDTSVHMAIYAASANPFLEDTLKRLRALNTRIWHVGLAGRMREVNLDEVHEHSSLLEAVADGSAEEAAKRMTHHMEQSDRRFQAQIRG